MNPSVIIGKNYREVTTFLSSGANMLLNPFKAHNKAPLDPECNNVRVKGATEPKASGRELYKETTPKTVRPASRT